MGFKEFKKKFLLENYDVEDDADYMDEYDDADSVKSNVQDNAGSPYVRTTDNGGVSLASRSSIEMKVVTPTRYDAVTQIADLLLEKKTVLLNLENTNKETAKRLIDFLSGVAYALNGDVQKVADNTFAVTPQNVAVSNENIDSFTAEAATVEDLYE